MNLAQTPTSKKAAKVSVICLCYNHAKYVCEAIDSVVEQDYPNVELIVVDDASTDGSQKVIQKKLANSATVFIANKQNLGNCKAFNLGFRQSTGQYIIDLAADDLLLPNRISEGIRSFENKNIGVHFSDSYLMNPAGSSLGTHYKRNASNELIEEVPEGAIYLNLIEKYFISPPTMMMKRQVLEELNGYDETLSYEDFDFWVRSSRNHHYGFTDKVLVKKRLLNDSLSKKQFRFRTKHQKSTLKVCQKIMELNRNKNEDNVLRGRCWYEIRQCIKQGNLELIPGFLKVIVQISIS